MIGIGIANSIGLNSAAAAPDPAAQAYFAATGITGATQQQAINNLVKGLKQDGLWSKMKAVYPFVTDNRNLLSYTEDFSTSWLRFNTIVNSNTTTAPNGTLTADSLIDNTSNTSHPIFQFGNPLTTGPMVGSVYLKDNGRRFAVVSLTTGSGTNTRYSAVVDLQTGTITQNNTLGSPTNTSSSIESVGDGWYRVSVRLNCTLVSTSINYLVIATSNTGTPTTFDSGTLDPSYIGNGSSIFLWGAQLELGSTATTYQPIATTQQAFISNQFKYNLVNPVDSDAAFRLVFNGGWTHSANGATPNGTNGYADTKLVPSSVLLQDSTHLSYYSRTNISGNQAEIGAILQGDTRRIQMELRYLGNFASDQYNYSTGRVGVTNADSLGYYIGSRLNSTTHKAFKNNIQLGSTNTDAAGLISAITHSIYIGATNNNTSAQYYSSKQTAFASIGNGLTDTEASNLYTRVQAFQNSLNRAVI